MQYALHIRSQHSRGSSKGFGGPDTYVAVTVAPNGVTVPYVLNSDVLAKRGIRIKYFGEGYREHDGPRSALGKTIAAARSWITAQQETKTEAA